MRDLADADFAAFIGSEEVAWQRNQARRFDGCYVAAGDGDRRCW